MVRVEVRRATQDDWRECRALRLRALADSPNAFASTLERERGFSDRAWRRRLTTGFQLLAYEGASIVGTVTGIPDRRERRAREVVALWVDPDARGRGVGVALIEGLVTWARDISAPALTLWVADGNDEARRLYERRGFAPTGDRNVIRDGIGEIRMRLPLS